MNLFLKIKSFITKFIRNKQGSNAIEYAIIGAAVAVMVLVIFKNESGNSIYDLLFGVFDALKNKLVSL